MSGRASPVSEVENFDQLLQKWCGYGRWQMMLVMMLSLVFFFLPFYSMSTMFIGATPDFRCADGFSRSATYNDVPANASRCLSADGVTPCSRWVFDKSVYISTIVTQWNLVCSRRPMLSMMQALLMFGGLTGSLVASQLGDIVGRRPLFLSAIIIFVSMAFTTAFSTSLEMFAVARFFTGVGMCMMIEGEMVIIAELVPPRKRAAYIFMMMVPFPVAIVLMSTTAYFIRTHWILEIILAVPTVVLFFNFWIVPESPRWLIAKGKFEQALRVFETGAYRNGKSISSRQELIAQMRLIRRQDNHINTKQDQQETCSWLANIKELVSTTRMRLNILVGMFIRFSACSAYFGLSFDITQLSKNPFLAGALTGLAELPVYFFFPIINRLGRVPCTAGSFFTSTLSMLLVFAWSNATFWLLLGLIGKLSVTMSFCMVYIHTPEYLPTSVRVLGSALSQMAMRFGGAMSSFVVDMLTEVHPAGPSLVFGTLTLIAGVASLLLPETVNKPLPETVGEVDALYKNRSDGHDTTVTIRTPQ